MDNILLVARHEFMTNIRKKSFLFAVIGMPIIIAVIMVIAIGAQIFAFGSGLEVNTLGYVDDADILTSSDLIPVDWVRYADYDTVRVALENGAIDAFFWIPEGYLLTGTVAIYAYGNVPDALQWDIEAVILDNLTASLTTSVSPERLNNPINLTYFMENSGREMSEAGLAGLFTLPMLFIVVLMISLQFSSMYLMSGVAEEKTNFIMEILITSIKPSELLAGKLFGLGALGLLQVVIWMMLGAFIMAIGGDTEFLSAVEFPLEVLALAFVYFFLTYFMYASLLAGVGAIVGSEQESRQYASWLMFPIALPFFFYTLLLFNPDSPVFIVFMMIPFTSAITFLMRLPFAAIPAWQVIVSLAILVLSTGFITWASAKVFRWALLLHGKKFGVKTLFRVIKGSVDAGIVPVQEKEG